MTQGADIAISALACRYPDAATPEALWSNVLEGRRSFRALPPERIDLDGYRDDRVGRLDSITPIRAGLISDWTFDRARFRIPQAAYGATDLAHWLALEVAAQAIEAIGGPDAVERERVAVVVANTLTGEFSRANSLRLRLPFLDTVVAQACDRIGLDAADAAGLRREFGAVLRGRLAEPNEETLAGGLANTIAGRIANHFDFKGGAYVIDAACASSLVALADAANLIETDAVDVVLVVAVDLSLDPFELVGFSRIGALATDVMRVFDARSSGFWPGEGAGAAVLARGAEAARRGLPRIATLRGCGISTDGAGGLTRPDCDGQYRALARAYARADADPADLMMVEAHGTGTAVGDPTEIRALARLVEGRREPLAVGSIKANIGHTKAAAGLAGLIKAVYALNAGIVPPHVGCEVPHPVFDEVGNRVYPALDPAMPPPRRRAIAGVSGFGFGGINAHVVVEAGQRRGGAAAFLPARPRHQDAELFLFSAAGRADLLSKLDAAAARAPRLSLSEFVDLASHCARHAGTREHRLAIVASGPEQFCERSGQARQALADDRAAADDLPGVFLGRAGGPARIGFLFPGQAAPLRRDGGIWARRFELARDALASVPAAAAGADPQDTAIAQPTIAAASLAALSIVEACGVVATVATGHSLGEVTALAWAEAIERGDLVALAARRGAIMSEFGEPGGAMLLLRCAPPACRDLMAELDLVVACENAAQETVVSGRAGRIAELERRAREAGTDTVRLPVSHAFHSPLMATAAPHFGCALGGFPLRAPGRRVLSPTLGRQVTGNDDVRRLLVRQFVAPVRFDAALAALASETDLVIELGPGDGLSRLAVARGVPCLSVDAFAESLAPLLSVLGAAFVRGAELDPDPLYADRSVRAIDLAARPRFLANPCGDPGGVVPPAVALAPDPPPDPPPGIRPPPTTDPAPGDAPDPLAAVLAAVAEATGLPEAGLAPSLRFLDDLHLNSLAVGRIVAAACGRLGLAVPQVLTDYAGGSLEQLADNLGELERLRDQSPPGRDTIAGVASWIACFRPVAEMARGRPGGDPLPWRVQPVGALARLGPPLGQSDRAPEAVLLQLGDGRDAEALPALWQAVREVLDSGVRHLGLLHSGAPVSAFARSLYQEGDFDSVAVVRSDGATPEQAVAALAGLRHGFHERHVSADGSIRTPQFELAPQFLLAEEAPGPGRFRSLERGDVVLVTGGTRGIGAECALRLAQRLGLKLALCGRSGPDHPEVRRTLERARATGIDAIYRAADVADPAAIARLVAAAARELGPIAGVIHAAGVNRPARFRDIGLEELERTRAAKDLGLRKVLAALDLANLKIAIAFGSIIGRLGLAGETHYALANAAQTALLEDFAARNPGIRTLSLEWSVWAGIGMGERLGTLDRLGEQGIEALSLDGALDTFERVVAEQPSLHGPLVVTGRFAPMAELLRGCGELPLNRFLETVRVHYPGVELVADSVISAGSDPYLLDHRIDGEMVMPGVMALEAMAAVAQALAGDRGPTRIRNLRFEKAVCVSEHGGQTLRVAALRRGRDAVSCTVRASDDGFAAVRASADFGFAERARDVEGIPFTRPAQPGAAADDLYGGLFFNRGRFQLVAEFSRLTAFELCADLNPPPATPWFGSFLPQTLVLGEPGTRDAGLHALQATIPQRRVIPVAAEEIELIDPAAPRRRVEARQVAGDRTTFVYDIVFRDEAGRIVERWHRATFRAIAELPVEGLPRAMLVPWLEREVSLSFDRNDIKAALVTGPDRAQRREDAIAALGLTAICHRADGRPLILGASGDAQVSISHSGETTLAVTADGAIGCDLEAVLDSIAVPGAGGAATLDDWCLTEALRKIGCDPAALETWPPEAPGAANPGGRVRRLGDLDVMCRRWGAAWIVAIALRSRDTAAPAISPAPATAAPPGSGPSNAGELLDEPG